MQRVESGTGRNEMRTASSSTAEQAIYPSLALCASRAALLPKEGIYKKRGETKSEEGRCVSLIQLPEFF